MGFIEKSEEVLSMIRQEYIATNHSVSVNLIFKCYKGFGDNELRSILKYLVGKNTLKQGDVFGTFIPVFNTEEFMRIMPQKKVEVTLEKINNCISIFFNEHGVYPLSSDIANTFIKLYGSGDIEDIPRECRRLVAWGQLDRDTYDRYMPKVITFDKKPLAQFINPLESSHK